ncbi:hypothetical protein DPX16_18275 [Anabarilius grahami]|uniref:Uncharacterized protein n=1 Tax=Anabarilius grahami TaxID=495550 RepID=A0A3N0YEQ1_ANAGA|nr:hypothetical protein DPX16_18275 [Anabarilius grahami]
MALHSYLSFHCCKFDALSSAEEVKPLNYTRSMSGNFFVVPDRFSATPPSPGNERWMEGCRRGRPRVCDFSRALTAVSAADAAAQARGSSDTSDSMKVLGNVVKLQSNGSNLYISGR